MTNRDDDSPVSGENTNRHSEGGSSGNASRRDERDSSGNASHPDEREWRANRHENRRTAPPRAGDSEGGASETDDLLLFIRDVAVSILAVVLIGGYIFMISGVWPPMVAIESGSMEPNMEVNDLVFVMDADRFQPDAAHGESGVVTAAAGSGADYQQFGDSGDVIVFNPQGNERVTPIIHRAMLWVDGGENWYDRANEEIIGNADNCAELVGCPAPHQGFITKGDDNPTYDQTGNGRLDPVKPEWVVGTAEYRIPRAGWLRLRF